MMSRICTRQPKSTGVWALAAVCGLAAGASGAEVRVIARTNQNVPGGTVQFSRFGGLTGVETPVISESGRVAFMASLKGSGVSSTNDRALFRAGPSGVESVARTGAAAPLHSGSGPAVFFSLNTPMINNEGDVAFGAVLSGTGVVSGVNARGYWLFESGQASLLVREDDSIPSTYYLRSFAEPVLAKDGSGRVSFRANVVGTGLPGTGVLGYFQSEPTSADPDAFETLVRVGAESPIPGLTYRTAVTTASRSGRALVRATLGGATVTTATSQILVSVNPLATGAVQVEKVARQGDPAPGGPAGAVFTELYSASATPVVNAAGKCAFAAPYSMGGVIAGSGIWSSRAASAGSAVSKVAIADEAVDPVAYPGLTFGSLLNYFGVPHVAIADSGTVVFLCSLAGVGVNAANNNALVTDTAGARKILARGLMQAPGAGPGVTFVNTSIGTSLRINSHGQVAFLAQLEGPGVNLGNDWALFTNAGSPGELRMVARDGDPVPSSNGLIVYDLRQSALHLNDTGQILISLRVAESDDGSGMVNSLLGVNTRGELRPLAIEQAAVQTADGQTLPIATLRVSQRDVLNSAGEVAFCAALATSVPGDDFVGVVRIDETPRCAPDFNGSGTVTVDDIFAYLSAWFSNVGLAADFDGSGEVAMYDLFAFLGAWFGGCP